MIQDIEIPYTEIKNRRKHMKENWITSVEACKYCNTKKLRKLCNNHPDFHALRVNISGTIKYWFDRGTFQAMLDMLDELQ